VTEVQALHFLIYHNKKKKF